MALTLAEAAKLSNDVLLTGVIETILQDSPILQAMPFVERMSMMSCTFWMLVASSGARWYLTKSMQKQNKRF